MIILDDFQELKRRCEELQREKDRAEGALGQLLARLKKEYGCKTLDEARKLLAGYEERERKAARVFTEKKRKFEEEFKDVLKS